MRIQSGSIPFATYLASGSIVQLIDNSHIFKQWWVNSQTYNTTIANNGLRNLRASQSRFSSHIKPLGRLVLYFGVDH